SRNPTLPRPVRTATSREALRCWTCAAAAPPARGPLEPDQLRPVARGRRGGHCGPLLEAARWAPSAGNSQPWAFIVGRRGDSTHRRLITHLAGSSARWAPTASLLIANLAHRCVEDTEWEYSEFSVYDLGHAV